MLLTLGLLTLAPFATTAAQQERTSGDETAATPSIPLQSNETVKRPAKGQTLASRFGLAFTTATLGLGADVVFRAADPVNVRIGFSTFHYGQNGTQDGVAYHGVLSLQSMRALVDLYPFSHGFHVSPGLLFHNANRVTARAAPPTGQVLSTGDQTYISDPNNPIVGSAKSHVHSVAPMLMVGFGNLAPRKGHFTYSVDAGVVYQGPPQSSFNLAGGACDPSGQFCASIADAIDVQGAVQSARRDLDNGVSFMRYYPLFSVSFGYHF